MLGSCGAESAVVECVECLLPSLGPAGLTLAGRVQGHDGAVDALERGNARVSEPRRRRRRRAQLMGNFNGIKCPLVTDCVVGTDCVKPV